MSKYFIDLGGHDGCSIRKFKKVYDTNDEYSCITFEANKIYSKYYSNLKNHILIDKAAYIYDGKIEMNMDRNHGGFGSSIIKEKNDRTPGQLDRKNPDLVDCINFSQWIKNNFNEKDYILVKMDIEGSEYDILEKMIEDDTIKYINKLYIEWHNKKLNIENINQRHNLLLKNLKKCNLKMDDSWCAIKYSTTYKQSPYYGKNWNEL